VFGITAQTQYLLRLDNAVPDALVIGISRTGSTDVNVVGPVRSFDLSPSRDLGEEKVYLNRYKRETPTGGAAAFLRVFLDELIPDIERTYRTNGDRTYIGYSLGGLFGAYALF
jgi:predicted alpha/beta superfamily hydrolase